MTEDQEAVDQLFTGSSEMATRMRSIDWSETLLGAIETWPQSLRSALSICLNSRFPIAIYWGQDCLLLYNDAWRPIVGNKHPWSLGRPGREVWSEIWDDIGPELAGVLATGEGTFHHDELLAMHRFGYTEECFFEYTFNPIQGRGGVVDGVFNIVTETTYRVLSDRRAQLLRELASRTGIAKTTEEACALMMTALKSDPADIPFALLYLIDADERSARLCGSVPFASDSLVSPEVVHLTATDDHDGWLLSLTVRTAQPQVMNDLVTRFGALPGSPWSEPIQEAVVVPIIAPGQGKITGVLVAAASPRRKLDERYHDFFSQVARQIAMVIANARAYEEERKRAEALAEIDRAKTIFFSNISHEFRTPLALMLGPIEDALTDPDEPLPATQLARIETVQRNGTRLLKLVNTLLDFSRIEAGRVQISYEATDLAAYTAELASVFRSAIERAGMRLVVDCPPLPELVYVDREMWEKIVLNLLSNAFKFTFTGEISVQLQYKTDHVELGVRDTGIGIPAAELPHLFERFHRVQGAQGRSIEGSGIGLSLVQELVKLHQGTIAVASVAGEGTCFTIAIPTGTLHLPQDRINVARSLSSTALRSHSYVEEALRWLPEQDTAATLLHPALEERQPAPASNWQRNVNPQSAVINPQSSPSARILLADDNADMRDYVKRLLSQQYEVEAVSDGAAALTVARQRIPDLVLTDVMMPQLDGFGLLQALRATPQTRDIPIILLSARAGEEARVEGLAAGADDYLTKPFSARELIARVEASLKLAQLRRETETIRTRLENVLAGINDQFIVLDRNWHYTFVNDQVTAVTGQPKEALLGRCIWDLFPDVINSPFDVAVRRAVAEQTFVQVEVFYPPFQRWFENRIYPLAGGVTIFVSDISKRKQAEADREELLVREQTARAQAEQANRIKDEFLAVLSHELRSPLNPILGWAKLLQSGKLDETKTAQALATIERNAKLQSELIEDLLDVSRILRGKLSLNVTPVNLATMIRGAMETVRLAAEAKSIQITASLTPDVGLVLGDATRLQQAIWNLLANAVKFTPTGGSVEISLALVTGPIACGDERQPSSLSPDEQKSNDQGLTINYAQITVSDTGQGIAPDFLPYVFDYFRQADGATTRKFGGLGLGLAIVRHLVELHGGTVKADSLGEGQGATFTIRLPLLPTPPQANQDERSPQQSLDLNSIKILVVDDETDTRELVAFALEQQGAQVTTVASAHEALLILPQAKPDVLLSDIGMPDMDGYMLIQQVRALTPDQGGQIPAIALTAYAGDTDRRRVLAAGFQKHIAKPIAPEKLVQAIMDLVRSTS